jgi:uncharacterized membrane protein
MEGLSQVGEVSKALSDGVKQGARSLSNADIQLEKTYDKIINTFVKEKDREKALKIRKGVTGLPGSIAVIVFIVASILLIIILNIISIACSYEADKKFKSLEKGSSTTGTQGDSGDSYLSAGGVLSIIIGVLGIIFALTITILFVIRFVIKPYKARQLNSTVDSVDSILGSRFSELIVVIPAGVMILFFILWMIVNSWAYANNRSIINKEKVIEQETSTKLRDARNGSFALTGIINGLTLVYPIIVSAIVIIYLIIGQVRLTATVNALTKGRN